MLLMCFNEQLGEVVRVMELAHLLWHVEGPRILDRCRSFAAQPTAALICWVPAAATATATATASLPSKALQSLIRPYKLIQQHKQKQQQRQEQQHPAAA